MRRDSKREPSQVAQISGGDCQNLATSASHELTSVIAKFVA
jgi:hypothetical protein